MKRTVLFTICTLLLSLYNVCGESKILINGVEKVVDTLEYRQIGPGMDYTKINLPDYPIDAYILTVDLKNENNKIETFQAQNKVRSTEAMTKVYDRMIKAGRKPLAGVNGNFWIVSGQGMNDLIGIPHSGSIINGTMVTDPNEWNRGHGAIGFATIDESRKLHIDDMQFSGKVTIDGVGSYPISEINRKRPDNELVFFNEYASTTNTDNNGTEVFIKPVSGQIWGVNKDILCEVVRVVKDKGENQINSGESVLSGHGSAKEFLNNLTIGNTITVNMGIQTLSQNLRPAITQMITGNALVMKDGELTDRNQNESYNTTLYPRTAIGMSKDGTKAFLIVIDKMGTSKGANTETMCGILKNAGAWNVASMDGGGSAQMMLEGKIVNKPADGRERAVANGWLLFSTSPTDTVITRIEFYDYILKIPTYTSIKPQFIAYNQYNEVVNNNLQGVKLSCDENLGNISADGSTFYATAGTAENILRANYNGITVSKKITVESGNIEFKLNSITIDNTFSYPIEISSTIGNKTYMADPAIFSWIIEDETICKVENGILKGLKNGKTKITGKLDTISQDINVTVEISTNKYLTIENFSDINSFKIKPTSNLTNFIVQSETDATKISYKYTSDIYSTIDFEKNIQLYSLPDSIILKVNTGNINFNKISLFLRQNNETIRRSVDFKEPKIGQDVELKIPIKQFLTDSTDIASYPILLSKISFYLDDTKHSINSHYYFFVKDIQLVYSKIKDEVGVEINDYYNETKVSIYPNPVKQGENIKVKLLDQQYAETIFISIYSLNGVLVNQEEVTVNGNNEITIKTTTLTSGNYIIRLQSKNGSVNSKITIQ